MILLGEYLAATCAAGWRMAAVLRAALATTFFPVWRACAGKSKHH
jgi:hypothetical protein